MTIEYGHNNNSPTSKHDTSKIMLSAICSLSFVIILVILLHFYVRCALRAPRRQFTIPSATFVHTHEARHEPVAPKTGLDAAVINSIPSFQFKQLNSQDDIECTVCLSMLENNDLARRLPNCNHIFHVECIDTWLTGQSTCPICRSEAAPRLDPLDREPPRGGDDIENTVVGVSVIDHNEHDQQASSSGSKVIRNGSGPSNSSSFRLSSFRKMIGRDRSSSSRRVQVNTEIDLERQSQQ